MSIWGFICPRWENHIITIAYYPIITIAYYPTSCNKIWQVNIKNWQFFKVGFICHHVNENNEFHISINPYLLYRKHRLMTKDNNLITWQAIFMLIQHHAPLTSYKYFLLGCHLVPILSQFQSTKYKNKLLKEWPRYHLCCRMSVQHKMFNSQFFWQK